MKNKILIVLFEMYRNLDFCLFRASFGNPKGFGPFSASSPKSVVPSTWRSVQKKDVRIKNQAKINLLCQFIEEGKFYPLPENLDEIWIFPHI